MGRRRLETRGAPPSLDAATTLETATVTPGREQRRFYFRDSAPNVAWLRRDWIVSRLVSTSICRNSSSARHRVSRYLLPNRSADRPTQFPILFDCGRGEDDTLGTLRFLFFFWNEINLKFKRNNLHSLALLRVNYSHYFLLCCEIRQYLSRIVSCQMTSFSFYFDWEIIFIVK